MSGTKFLLLALSLVLPSAWADNCPSLLNFTINNLNSKTSTNFCSSFNGKLILAVNTASNCGYTPQFAGLEALYKKYQSQGLVVLGFPSNDFHQEFAEAEKTAKVCYLNYGVSFPMFEKSSVSGTQANPFFKQLIERTGQEPQWNFHKYLISADGSKILAFPSATTPEQLEQKITELLANH